MIWYTVRDAARVARVPERTLRRAVEKGQIPAIRISPRRTYVWWSDVEAWLLGR